MFSWAFIDDQFGPSSAFADQFKDADAGLDVFVLGPADAREKLLSAGTAVDGALIDVDLSDVPGEHGSGPGIAQDIRVNQENGRLGSFPLVRFSYRTKVLANIGGDASSDDLFDLKFDKEFAARHIAVVRNSLIGCSYVYQEVAKASSFSANELASFLGLTDEMLESWTHPDLIARAESARADRPHVASALVMRLLTHPGPLIDEELLAVRLGVRRQSPGWAKLSENLDDIKYRGAGCEFFERWWARGLEDWWVDSQAADTPLSSMTISQRMEQLSGLFPDLVPIEMPPESLGARPWRLCSLSLEEEEPAVVPVDPAFGVKIAARGNVAPWVDVSYAALGVALQHRDDRRLNRADLERHAALWQ